MSNLELGRSVLSVTLAALIGGCAAPGAAQPSAPAQQAPHSASSGDGLIYAFGHYTGFVVTYPAGKAVSSFGTGLINTASCSDDLGNVFLGGIGDTGTPTDVMLKYPYGGTTPSASENLGFVPSACSVDNTTGNVAVAVHSPYWAVEVLPGFSQPSKIYRAPGADLYRSVGYDGNGNLFVLGTASQNAYFLAEMPKRATAFSQISLDLGTKIGSVRTIQWDGSYMTIEASVKKSHTKPKDYPQEVFRLSISGSKATVVGTTTFNQLKGERPGSSWIQPDLGIFVFACPHITVWNYPGGGKAILYVKTKSIGGQVDFATVATPASP